MSHFQYVKLADVQRHKEATSSQKKEQTVRKRKVQEKENCGIEEGEDDDFIYGYFKILVCHKIGDVQQAAGILG